MGSTLQDAVEFIDYYVHEYNGKRIITDFDGKQPRLSARVNLTENPIRSFRGRKELKRIVGKVNKWVKSLQEK